MARIDEVETLLRGLRAMVAADMPASAVADAVETRLGAWTDAPDADAACQRLAVALQTEQDAVRRAARDGVLAGSEILAQRALALEAARDAALAMGDALRH